MVLLWYNKHKYEEGGDSDGLCRTPTAEGLCDRNGTESKIIKQNGESTMKTRFAKNRKTVLVCVMFVIMLMCSMSTAFAEVEGCGPGNHSWYTDIDGWHYYSSHDDYFCWQEVRYEREWSVCWLCNDRVLMDTRSYLVDWQVHEINQSSAVLWCSGCDWWDWAKR